MKTRYQTYLAVLGCWVLWGFFNASRLRFVVPDLSWTGALRFGLPDALIWAALTPIPILLVRRFPMGEGRNTEGVAAHVLTAIGVATAHTAIDATQNALAQGADAVGWIALFTRIFRFTFHHNLMMYAVVVGVAYYLAHRSRIAERDRHAAELRARLSEARLNALRMQLRPHFLFNVLHTISGLMEADPSTGRRVVRQLGELLRMSLAADDLNEVPLERELKFVRLYLELEQVRFGDRLTIEIGDDPELLQCAVPVLILQPLVENAVRHGVATRSSGGRISVSARRAGERLELTVEDDGPGMRAQQPVSSSRGVGLSNTRSRLQALYGDDHAFHLDSGDLGGLRATVSIPLRQAVTPTRSNVA